MLSSVIVHFKKREGYHKATEPSDWAKKYGEDEQMVWTQKQLHACEADSAVEDIT